MVNALESNGPFPICLQNGKQKQKLRDANSPAGKCPGL